MGGCASSKPRGPTAENEPIPAESGGEDVQSGIYLASDEVKKKFLEEEWGPHWDLFEEYLETARHRARAGWDPKQRYPFKGRELPKLVSTHRELTSRWYGGGRWNLSAFYEFFVKLADIVGVTRYRWTDIPTKKSDDEWIKVIDGRVRKKILKNLGQKASHGDLVGEVAQAQGESAIDNSVLSNVFKPEDARAVLGGAHVKKMIVNNISKLQYGMLRRVSELFDDVELSRESPERIKEVLSRLTDEQLAKAKIKKETMSWHLLVENGCVLQDWGQIGRDNAENMESYVANELKQMPTMERGGSDDHVFESLVKWSQEHPGEYFNNSKEEHLKTLFAGVWIGDIALMKRTVVEDFTLAKYFWFEWERVAPLTGSRNGGEKRELVRPANSIEFSRVRANECPYADSHGMSLAGGGVDETAGDKLCKQRKKDMALQLVAEMGLPVDPSMRVENWGLTDIEKILREVCALNPPEAREHWLPGEESHDVGQNPKVGSSIKATQHTQITKHSLSGYPVYQLENEPKWSEFLNCHIDVVQVGKENDAFFVKTVTKDPTYPDLIRFLQGMREHLVDHYGSVMVIDFNVKAVPTEMGEFVVLFTPIAQCTVSGGVGTNTKTGEQKTEKDLPVLNIDTAKGAGHFMVGSDDAFDMSLKGKEYVVALYDHCRMPGCRDVVHEFIEQQLGLRW